MQQTQISFQFANLQPSLGKNDWGNIKNHHLQLWLQNKFVDKLLNKWFAGHKPRNFANTPERDSPKTITTRVGRTEWRQSVQSNPNGPWPVTQNALPTAVGMTLANSSRLFNTLLRSISNDMPGPRKWADRQEGTTPDSPWKPSLIS